MKSTLLIISTFAGSEQFNFSLSLSSPLESSQHCWLLIKHFLVPVTDKEFFQRHPYTLPTHTHTAPIMFQLVKSH